MSNQRRMFSSRIVDSGKFLQMSPSAQSLYFHLGMKTDDDGVVEALTVMQTVNAAQDDFKVLVVKGFIKPLNEELVSFITDWNEHNQIRPDRLVPSIYRELLVRIVPEVVLTEPRRRADLPMLSTGRPLDRLSKVKLSKVNTSEAELRVERVTDETPSKAPSKKKYPNARKAFAWFPRPLQAWHINNTELAHGELLYTRGEEQVRKALKFYEEYKDERFCPQITKPSDLERKWDALFAFSKKVI